MPDNWIVATIF